MMCVGEGPVGLKHDFAKKSTARETRTRPKSIVLGSFVLLLLWLSCTKANSPRPPLNNANSGLLKCLSAVAGRLLTTCPRVANISAIDALPDIYRIANEELYECASFTPLRVGSASVVWLVLCRPPSISYQMFLAPSYTNLCICMLPMGPHCYTSSMQGACIKQTWPFMQDGLDMSMHVVISASCRPVQHLTGIAPYIQHMRPDSLALVLYV